MAALFGVHENLDPAATAVRVGANATRVFTPGVIDPRDLVKEVQNKCGPTWAAGMCAVWSFKPRPDAVASGAWKPFVQALGRWLADHPQNKIVVIVWHEPENDVPKWFADAAGFVTMFDTVAGWLRQTWPAAVLAHAALAYRYGDGRGITDRIAPQWRTSADIHCADVYSGRSNPLATILPELSSYRRWRQFVAQKSPWGITERGWTVGTDTSGVAAAIRTTTIGREAAWLDALTAADRPRLYLLWNTAGTEGDAGLVFDAAAEQVARTALTVVKTYDLDAPGPSSPPAAPARTLARPVTCPQCHFSFTPPTN